MDQEKDLAAISRRKFVSSVGALGAMAALPISANALGSINATENTAILKSGPYLQAPTFNSITIRWITNVPCFSWVEYGLSADKLDKQGHTTELGFHDTYNTVNGIDLNGLEPGTTYYYRICSKKIEVFEAYKMTFGDTYTSPVHTFKTATTKADKFSFLVFNDIHDRPASFTHLLKFNEDKKHDFVFLNGDMFDYQTDEDQLVNHLLQPFGDMFATTPFFFSRGNHETRGKFARNIPDYFNGHDAKFYFSFQYGDMYAIVLDSGEDKEDEHAAYYGMVDFDNYRKQQAAWLEKEIQKPAFKKAKYKVVFSHIPLFYSGDWHGTTHCRQSWNHIFNKAKIDVLISGHTHTHGIHPAVKGQHNYPIVIGGGPLQNKRTLITVEFDNKALNLKMVDDSGKTVGTLTV